MNWKNRLTNYNFWISIFSAVLLILQALKIEFDIAYVNEIFTAVLGLLVVIGIINDPTRTSVKTEIVNKNETSNKEELKPVEEKVEESNVKEEQKEEVTLPVAEKDASDCINNENDFQTLLNGLSESLHEQLKEMEKSNMLMLKKLDEKQEKINVKEKQEIDILKEEVVLPAAAEMNNPYIDTIN